MELLKTIQDILAIKMDGNLLSDWLLGFFIALGSYQILKLVRSFLSRQLCRGADWEQESAVVSVNGGHGEDANVNWGLTRFAGVMIAATANWFLLVMCIYAGFQVITLPPKLDRFVNAMPVLVLFFQLAVWVKKAVEYKLMRLVAAKTSLEERQQFSTMATPIKYVILFLLWALILLAVLDNLGVNITALVAGLGIGGVAVALAVQSTLGDLLGALTIAFDKPFIVGDFIVTGEMKGTIEKIGLKTTRLRSLGGEELIFPNQDLLKSRIQNFKRMEERRIVFSFGVLYQTPVEKLRKIPEIVRDIVMGIDHCRFDRAHFFKLGESSYEFEVVYFVLNPDYATYMDCQQKINLALIERFEAHAIEFPHPTRTLYVESGGAPISDSVGIKA